MSEVRLELDAGHTMRWENPNGYGWWLQLTVIRVTRNTTYAEINCNGYNDYFSLGSPYRIVAPIPKDFFDEFDFVGVNFEIADKLARRFVEPAFDVIWLEQLRLAVRLRNKYSTDIVETV